MVPASVVKLKNAFYSALSAFLHKIFIEQKLNNFAGYALLSFFAVALGYLFARETGQAPIIIEKVSKIE